MSNFELMIGDCSKILETFKPNSINAVCTSIPFWQQRTYESGLGREATRSEWSKGIVDIFEKIMAVLHPTGTAFVVVGETWTTKRSADIEISEVSLQAPYLAEDLRAFGWLVKSMVVIEYVNRTPQSQKNRPIQIHDYGILLAKSKNYFWDYVSSKDKGVTHDVLLKSVWSGTVEKAYVAPGQKTPHGSVYPTWIPRKFLSAAISLKGICPECKSPWTPIVSKPSGGSIGKSWNDHSSDETRGNKKTGSSQGYKPPVIEGWSKPCSCGSKTISRPTVLDPFTGTSTTGVAALDLNANYIGIDVDPESIKTSKYRLTERLETNKPMGITEQSSMF